MAAVHSIEGLIKWVRRDDWAGAFDAVFQRHVGEACRSAGIELDELADIIGDHGVSNLWGCAFEDFVSSAPDERNVADDYLKITRRSSGGLAARYKMGLQLLVAGLVLVGMFEPVSNSMSREW